MNALEPVGEQAALLARHWWLMLVLGVVVFVAVCVVAALAVWHARRRGAVDDAGEETRRERRSTTFIWAGTGVTIAILLVVFADSLYASRNASKLRKADATVIEVEGLQWWWRIRHLDADASRIIETANELHLPVGAVVRLRLISNDVIHSLWIPRIHGKLDLIPGRVNELSIRATEVGTYRGVCAEFCGLQHARMGFSVVVHEPDDYERWLAAQRLPAQAAIDSLRREGERVFAERDCATCHRVRGTQAQGGVGPDLTHFGSRLTIAAGTAPNTRGHLAGWIADPQAMKPGTRMPRVELSPAELLVLVGWLESLK
jgi:cytochrome c oxidase subunit II